MPTVLREGPYRFYFWSGDREEPPHIHVEAAEKAAKFWLGSPVKEAWSKGFKNHEINRLRRIVEKNKQKFLEEWHEHLNNQR